MHSDWSGGRIPPLKQWSDECSHQNLPKHVHRPNWQATPRPKDKMTLLPELDSSHGFGFWTSGKQVGLVGFEKVSSRLTVGGNTTPPPPIYPPG